MGSTIDDAYDAQYRLSNGNWATFFWQMDIMFPAELLEQCILNFETEDHEETQFRRIVYVPTGQVVAGWFCNQRIF